MPHRLLLGGGLFFAKINHTYYFVDAGLKTGLISLGKL